jgi:hypothetical protein
MNNIDLERSRPILGWNQQAPFRNRGVENILTFPRKWEQTVRHSEPLSISRTRNLTFSTPADPWEDLAYGVLAVCVLSATAIAIVEPWL